MERRSHASAGSWSRTRRSSGSGKGVSVPASVLLAPFRFPFNLSNVPLPRSLAGPMAGLKLDGAGQAKMVSLEESMTIFQRANSAVENYALAVKRNQPTGSFMTNYKRQMPGLASKLKGQFGMISDLVTATSMSSTRGAS